MAAQDAGDLTQALSILEPLNRNHPDIFPITESLGLLYARQGDFAGALPLLGKAAQLAPRSDAAHVNLAAVLYHLHRNADSAMEFQRATELNPANQSALRSLGRVRMDLNQPAEAAIALNSALALAPTDDDLRLDCAQAMIAAHQAEAAIKLLAGLPDGEKSARAQSLMADASEQMDDYKAAADHLLKAVQIEPGEENQWRLGAEFLRHWTFDAAVRVFADAASRYPESRRIQSGLAASLFGARKYGQAIPLFATLLEVEPENSEFASMLGMACAAVSHEERPRCSVLLRYAEAHPADAHAAVLAAQSLRGSADPETERPHAHRLLDQALAADPMLAEAQLQMGELLQEEGKWQESIACLERAIALKASLAEAHYHLAQAYWRTGRKQEGQAQMDLQKQFARQDQEERDRSLNQITTFLLEIRP